MGRSRGRGDSLADFDRARASAGRGVKSPVCSASFAPFTDFPAASGETVAVGGLIGYGVLLEGGCCMGAASLAPDVARVPRDHGQGSQGVYYSGAKEDQASGGRQTRVHLKTLIF